MTRSRPTIAAVIAAAVALAAVALGLVRTRDDAGAVPFAGDAAAPLVPTLLPAREDVGIAEREVSADSPRHALQQFMAAWHDRVYARMATWSTWNADQLRIAFAGRRLEGYAVRAARRAGELWRASVTIATRTRLDPEIDRRSTLVTVVPREGGWAVAPGDVPPLDPRAP